ncbi:hypothetical protein QQX98_002116 [Neonectria punicea]|uniref:HNH nuclease domain-containing protein n=1 Tax=Neonectria punicea TaxID=979145 RepID=A0ABR1HKZ8_9HYPO
MRSFKDTVESLEATEPITDVHTSSSALTLAKTKRDQTRESALNFRDAYQALSKRLDREYNEYDDHYIEDEVELEKRTSERMRMKHGQAALGVELAKKTLHEILFEQDVIREEKAAMLLSSKTSECRYREAYKRWISAGGNLWHNTNKINRINNPGDARRAQPEIADCLLALYKEPSDSEKLRGRPGRWRSHVEAYYIGNGGYHGECEDFTWCHVGGRWDFSGYVKETPIIPFFLDRDLISEILFGAQSDTVEKSGNGLLLTTTKSSWFQCCQLVIVPVDPSETPIQRW